MMTIASLIFGTSYPKRCTIFFDFQKTNPEILPWNIDLNLEMVVTVRESSQNLLNSGFFRNYPKISWPVETSYFEDLYTPAIQVQTFQTFPLEGSFRDLLGIIMCAERIGNVQLGGSSQDLDTWWSDHPHL